jgi:hypothetical protein
MHSEGKFLFPSNEEEADAGILRQIKEELATERSQRKRQKGVRQWMNS